MPRIYTNFNSRPSARGDSFLLSLVRPSSTISIHAPPRGATTSKITSGGADVFQFTPLREGRLLKQVGLEARFLFQFTPLREGRRHSVRRRSKPARFQFTPLREGRLHLHRIILRRSLFQFTPLREGRPAVSVRRPCSMRISIHAPPRGATRREAKRELLNSGYFNSRPSARGDRKARKIIVLSLDFNSRPSARGDVAGNESGEQYATFQFTPLREGRRHWEQEQVQFLEYFNSRPSARGDPTRAQQRTA